MIISHVLAGARKESLSKSDVNICFKIVIQVILVVFIKKKLTSKSNELRRMNLEGSLIQNFCKI